MFEPPVFRIHILEFLHTVRQTEPAEHHAPAVNLRRLHHVFGFEPCSQICILPYLHVLELEGESEINIASHVLVIHQHVAHVNIVMYVPGVLIDDAALQQMDEHAQIIRRQPLQVRREFDKWLTAGGHD